MAQAGRQRANKEARADTFSNINKASIGESGVVVGKVPIGNNMTPTPDYSKLNLDRGGLPTYSVELTILGPPRFGRQYL